MRGFFVPLSSLATALTLVLAAPTASAPGAERGLPSAGEGSPCSHPLADRNRPVAPRGASPELAAFTDPTAIVEDGAHVRVADKDYIAPFARLEASDEEGICIEADSNVQDNTRLQADDAPVLVGRHGIVAHGAAIVADERPATIAHRSACPLPEPGPAPELLVRRRGKSEGEFAERRGRQPLANALAEAAANYGCDEVPGFMSFNALNRGVISDGAQLAAAGRVQPGVVLRPGYVTYPGRSLNSQRQADTAGPVGTQKVRFINAGDIVFVRGVLHVNECLAKGYAEMYYGDPSSVRGINRDPGTHHECEFNHSSEPPTLGGVSTIDPRPDKNVRIIGDAHLDDPQPTVMENISPFTSIRADEGEPFEFGHGAQWGFGTTFHALEPTAEDPEVGVDVGDNVTISERAVVHGGGRRARTGGSDPTPTHILRDSRVGAYAVVFRSFLEPETIVGRKAVLVGYDTQAPGELIPERCVKFSDTPRGQCSYFVEW
jgi:carbonic anhydrase/acetyltransferase-like protein (isoleucine patch superfamily)